MSFLLVACGLAWTALRDDPYTAVGPPDARPTAHPVGAARVLADLVRAVDETDAEAARALAPEDDAAAQRLLGDLVANAVDLDLTSFGLRYLDETGPVSTAGSWSAAVDTTWQLAGFDDRPARTEILVGFATEGDRVAVTSVGGGDRRTPVWLTGRVQVRRTPDTLVVDAAGEADRISRFARTAVPVVRRVLPEWDPELVVEVPATTTGLDAALDAEEGRYAGVAAVTAAADGSSGSDAPVHVFVNPGVFGELGAVGAQVVMSHEATHVASDAAGSEMPLWLLEGFADYVALRDVRLPETTTAAQITRRVRREGVPQSLPSAAEFDTTNRRLGAAYESAWLACQVLAESRGEEALVRLYRAVEDGARLAVALRRNFGFGEQALTVLWQERLTDLGA